jgi:hypothetical protein
MRRFGHIVIQFEAENPGVWTYHCHIAWHSSMGYTLTFLERPEEISNPTIPDIMAQTCKDWTIWTSRNTVEQIDSGI